MVYLVQKQRKGVRMFYDTEVTPPIYDLPPKKRRRRVQYLHAIRTGKKKFELPLFFRLLGWRIGPSPDPERCEESILITSRFSIRGTEKKILIHRLRNDAVKEVIGRH